MPTSIITHGLEELCFAFEDASRYLQDCHVKRITTASVQFLDLYTSFCQESADAGVMEWHLLRKVHPYMHLVDDLAAERFNPRSYSGWTDEGFMHHVVAMFAGHHASSAVQNGLEAWWPMFRERTRKTTTTTSTLSTRSDSEPCRFTPRSKYAYE